MFDNDRMDTQSIRIAENWYMTAKKHNVPEPEAAFRFMASWMAFNFLYSKEDGESEIDKIRSLVKNKIKVLKSYNPMQDFDVISILFEKPVFDNRIQHSYNYRDMNGVEITDNLRNSTNYYLRIKTVPIDPENPSQTLPKGKYAVDKKTHYSIKNFQRLNYALKNKRNSNDKKSNDEDPNDKILVENLLLIVYQIRCNLFHGEKQPFAEESDRDSKLVRAAAFIMEEYMKRLLNDNGITSTIEQRINSAEYDRAKEYTWGGADVIITNNGANPNLKKWLDESTARRLVVSQNSHAIIWLIEQMKPFADIDYLSKFDFYRTIAESANKYIETNGDNNAKCLLIEIYNSVKHYLK